MAEAGVGYVVLLDRMAFQKTKLDENGNPSIIPDGDEVVVRKGHFVPDWVEEWRLQAFIQSGMISPVAVAPQPAPAPEVGPPAPAVEEGPVRPKDTDSRSDWEAFATSDAVGMSEEEAKSYQNKGALADAVDARLNNPK